MEVFIVRPFGTKQGIDFDRVEAILIQPALKAVGIRGSTTASVLESGNIRADMFGKLLTADLVIADISIHNANVFYELGIRHALRDQRTFLIRATKGGDGAATAQVDEIPFDIKTDRYLSYPVSDPPAQLPALIAALRETLQSVRQDSPVFYTLPLLRPQDPDLLLTVPSDFGEEEELAKVKPAWHHQVGKLTLLAVEVESFAWQMPALRSIGETLFWLNALEAARLVWERVRQLRPDDRPANDRLSTIYQRLASLATTEGQTTELLTRSDQALKRLLTLLAPSNHEKRAEVYALIGRNTKTRWVKDLTYTTGVDRRMKALQSPRLQEALTNYERGFSENLNSVYAGINALWMLRVLLDLAADHPAVWDDQFESAKEASSTLAMYRERFPVLATCVAVGLDAGQQRATTVGEPNRWLAITRADLACLTQIDPRRVATLYRKALTDAEPFYHDAVRWQLTLMADLGVLPTLMNDVLAQLPPLPTRQATPKRHYLLFTGHMIDKPDRPEPRFPPEQEGAAKQAIRATVQQVMADLANAELVGIAGGANGGDTLFHEVCEELGIPTELFLATPRDLFVAKSVQAAGSSWVNRFNRLYDKLPVQYLGHSLDLPNWLRNKKDYSIWERNNLWMLYTALADGGQHMTLIALWDGREGDAAGGTAHMVREAARRGAQTLVIDLATLTESD